MSNNYFENQITLNDLPQVLAFAERTGRTVLVHSAAGVGKSASIYEHAEIMLDNAIKEATNPEDIAYYESFRGGNNVVEVRMALESPDTLKGVVIPVKQEDGTFKTVFSYADRWPTDPRFVGIIFFDECSSAPKSMQAMAYQALWDRSIGDLKFPEKALVVAAGNRVGDGGVAYELASPISNRCVQVEVRPDVDAFLEGYAYKAGTHGLITSYLVNKPAMLHTYNGDGDCPAFASPRSWAEMVDPLLKDIDSGKIDRKLAMNVMLEGMIGTEAAIDFSLYCEFGAKLPSISDILEGKGEPHTIEGNMVTGANYYIMYSCIGELGALSNSSMDNKELKKRIQNVGVYVSEYMKDEVELCMSLATSLRKIFADNKKRKGMMVQILALDGIKDIMKEYMQLHREHSQD